MDEYLELDPAETTGDFYLDNFLEEEVENSSTPSYEEEEEVEEIPDEDATANYLMDFLLKSLDEDTAIEAANRLDSDGLVELGHQKFASVHEEIAAKESNGNYRALPLRNGRLVSSAVGKYQFLWDTWGDKIAEATGVSSKEEFRNNPNAQEDFYHNHYLPKHALPWIAQAKRHLRTPLGDDQLMKLYHFRGPAGATKYLRGELADKPEQYNSSISTYTGISPNRNYFKSGGWVYAQTANIGKSHNEIMGQYSMGYTPVKPPEEIKTSAYTVAGYNNNSPKLAGQAPLPSEDTGGGFGYDDALRVTQVANTVAGAGKVALGVANTIKEVKGQAMSNTLSALAGATGARLNRAREQAELLRLASGVQNNFNDSVQESLGQTENIWDQ